MLQNKFAHLYNIESSALFN